MLALLAAVSLSLAPADEAPPPVENVVDGGAVQTVAPDLTPKLAPALAPELVHDGGTDPLIAAPSLSVYDVDLPVEATISIGSASLFAVVELLIKPTLEGDTSCRQMVGNGRCNPADLSAFDRYSVGRKSVEWGMFGDVALVSSFILPVLYLGLESIALPTNSPWGDFAGDLLVIAEAMSVTGAMQTIMKFAFRRPRPARYAVTDTPVTEFDAELSFPSGHTALVTAATTALSTTIFLRHPQSKVGFAVLAGGLLMSGLTAFSRVQSGQHFPTDVIVGALVGGFAGFAVPYLHRKRHPLMPVASFDPTTGSSMVGVAGRF